MLLLALAPGPARADEATVARQLYEKGMAHFQLGEYDDAIKQWQDGFRSKPVPEFLYNIGQAYRLSNRPDKALAAYKAYLRMAPEAANHVQVERHIAQLQALVDQQQKTATSPPTSTREPRGIAAGESHSQAATANPTSEAPPATTSAPAESGNALVASAPARKPITKKTWFWCAVAGGAVVVGGAVVLGVVLGGRDHAQTISDLRF